nr:hypothetical protein [Tanacetum cinerariifolium]
GRDFDALLSEEDTVYLLRELGHTGVINSLNDVVVDQMHQSWRTFTALINQGLSRKTNGLDKLRLSKAQILWGTYYQKNVDYVELLWEDFIYQIDNKVYKKQEKMYYSGFTKIYGAILPGCLTSLEMKESKAYKTFLGYATGAVPPKIARNFKKASPSKNDSNLVPINEEPVTKGKRVKRSVKKSSTKPTTGIVIRKPPVETKSKRKEKVDVTHGKGIDMLSKVAMTKEAQMKEVRKKSLRDENKTHPSGSGTVAKNPPRVEKITPIVTSEGTCNKPGVPDVTENDSTENESDESDSESDQQEYEEVKDDDEEEDQIVHTLSNSDDEKDANLESKNDDKSEGDEDRGMDDTTNQFNDDVQDKKADVEMTDAL